MAGTYYRRSTSPAGSYTLVESFCDGLPIKLTVATADCPVTPPGTSTDCGDPSTWPSAVTVTIVDNDHAPTDPLYAGGPHTLILQPGSTLYETILNGVTITLTCGGGGWCGSITPPGTFVGTTVCGGGGTPTQLTACPTDCSTCCDTIDWTVTWSDPPDDLSRSGTTNSRSGCVWGGGTSGVSFGCYVDTDGKAYWQAHFSEVSGADCNVYWRAPVYGPCPSGPWVPDPTMDSSPCIPGTLTTSSCGGGGSSSSGTPAAGTYTYIPSPNGSEWGRVAFTVS